MRRFATLVVLGLVLVPRPTGGSEPLSPADLAGTWAGTMSHDGATAAIAVGITPDTTDRVLLTLTIPAIHLDRVPMGRVKVVVQGDSVRLGPFRLVFDRRDGVLSGSVPRALVPAYDIPVRLQRTAAFEPPPRPPLPPPSAKPVWEHAVGSPLWAGPVFAKGVVYAGAEDGRVVALRAADGARSWEFRAGGRIRTRPSVHGDALYLQADDGFLYRLDARTGRERWRVRIVDGPIARLPFDDPQSRYDRFGSDVTVAGDRLYVGTHDGKLLARSVRDGRALWSFAAGDAILAAPALARGTLYFGSYDKSVYALDAATGRLRWKRETLGAVVSTPALAGDRVIVGNRAYDLLALHATTGEPVWKRHIWMSWVESSPTVRDGVVYTGSSDAAAVFAFDAATGQPRWVTDVFGWAWGQAAVAAGRVYAGTSSQVGYPARHSAGVVALARGDGKPVWTWSAAAPDSGAFGFPGSPALGGGLVFVTGLDGKVYAFAE